MPVRRVKGGYKWGRSGTVYPTKKQAQQQGSAIHATGYRKTPKKSGKRTI